MVLIYGKVMFGKNSMVLKNVRFVTRLCTTQISVCLKCDVIPVVNYFTMLACTNGLQLVEILLVHCVDTCLSIQPVVLCQHNG